MSVPIEGVTEYDVGQTKCLYQCGMTESYVNIIGLNGRAVIYQHPPEVAVWSYNDQQDKGMISIFGALQAGQIDLENAISCK